MKEFENNAYFWQKIDTIYFSSNFVLTQKKDSYHPVYTNLQYPCDYGILKNLSNDNEGTISCFKGCGSKEKEANAVVICADILKKDLEAKILVGVNEKEEESILHFLNKTEFQKTIIIRRGEDVPQWAISE